MTLHRSIHARPWPDGPTTAANLATLCRRHHRVKQRPGWTTRLDPDGTYTVTDPTGRTRSTDPPDHRRTPLPWTPGEPDPPPPSTPRLVLPDGPHSDLEHHLESALGGHHRPTPPCRVEIHHPRRPTTVSGTPAHRIHRRSREPRPETPPF